MAFDDRLQFLLLGMAIGFVLGYLVRLAQDIKQELDEVKDQVEKTWPKDEAGFMSNRVVADALMVIVLIVVAWATFDTQKTNNDTRATQDRIETISKCDQEILTQTLVALRQRSTYTRAVADQNIDLQSSQRDFFTILLHKPPYSEAKRSLAVQSYYRDLQEFLLISHKNLKDLQENDFPTVYAFSECLRQH